MPLPPLDLGRVMTIIDPRHECSTTAQARGQYMVPLIPAMSAPELVSVLPAVQWWSGFSGEPGRVPSPDLYAGLMVGASSLLFLGVGRFAAHVPPAVLASTDLSGCDAALLFDRCNTDEAYWAQLYRDNRKSTEQRRLESPGRVASLLLARGVRCVSWRVWASKCRMRPSVPSVRTYNAHACNAHEYKTQLGGECGETWTAWIMPACSRLPATCAV